MYIRSTLACLVAVTCAMHAPATAQQRDSRGPEGSLSGEVSLSKVLGSDLSSGENEEEDNGSATVARAALDYDLDFGATDVSVSYDTAAYFYDADDSSDRWSNRLAAGVGHELSETVELFGQAGYGSNLATPESGSADQVELLGRIQFSPDAANRLRLFSGYRWRDYDSDDSEGEGAFYGAEYRYRLAANHYLTADLRRENIESDTLRRGYDRVAAALFYQVPLARDLRLSTGLTARWWEFDGRFAPSGERLERRSYTPEIELQYAKRPGVLLRGRLQYILRRSNDPQFAQDQARAVLTAGYRF